MKRTKKEPEPEMNFLGYCRFQALLVGLELIHAKATARGIPEDKIEYDSYGALRDYVEDLGGIKHDRNYRADR